MFELKVTTHFAAAHQLTMVAKKCENLHGHNWKVEVCVKTEDLDKSGLGVDFKILKKETNNLLDLLDHKYLNELPAFQGVSPSSENIARFIYEGLEKALASHPVEMDSVCVWESDNACAAYSRS